jgi:hypothetical protein
MPVVQETRERERLMAPPRSAMPVPGEPGGFGRGLWRRLREAGGAVAFFGVFLTVGTGIFLFGLAGTFGPYKESLRENGDPRFFLAAMAFGGVFGLVAVRMLQLVLTGAGHSLRQKRKPLDRARPWTTDYPWRPEGMNPDYTGNVGGTILGRVAIFGLFGLFNMVFVEPSPWILRGIVLFFDAFALLLLYDTAVLILNRVRFALPRVRWATFPAFTGGRVEGTVLSPRRLRPGGPIRTILRCVRDEETSRDGHRMVEPVVIYKQVVEIPAGERGALKAIPFAFDVPPDLPGTDLTAERATYWQVGVEIPVSGPNLERFFLAPVYEAPNGAPSWGGR